MPLSNIRTVKFRLFNFLSFDFCNNILVNFLHDPSQKMEICSLKHFSFLNIFHSCCCDVIQAVWRVENPELYRAYFNKLSTVCRKAAKRSFNSMTQLGETEIKTRTIGEVIIIFIVLTSVFLCSHGFGSAHVLLASNMMLGFINFKFITVFILFMINL